MNLTAMVVLFLFSKALFIGAAFFIMWRRHASVETVQATRRALPAPATREEPRALLD